MRIRPVQLILPGLYTATVMGGAFAVTLAANPIAQEARNRAASLAAVSGSPTDQAQLLRLKLAVRLDTDNQDAVIALAKAQLALGQTDGAITTLERAQSGEIASQLKIRTLIETGDYGRAYTSGQKLYSEYPTNQNYILYKVAAMLLGQTSIEPTPPNIDMGQMARIDAGHVPFAVELKNMGLPVSAKRVLASEPVSFPRNVALAHLLLTAGTKAETSTAIELLKTATTLNPTSSTARGLLITALTNAGNTEQASAQQILLSQIEAGRP